MNQCSCSDSGNHSQERSIWQGDVEVLINEQVAVNTWRLRFRAPDIARHFSPGQFVMVRMPGHRDPLLGRPLAIYDVLDGDAHSATTPQNAELVDIVYLIVGRGTGTMQLLRPGQRLEAWGPLGKPFCPLACEHLIMVAGGIGQTPFLTLARQYTGQARYANQSAITPNLDAKPRITFCYGARTKDHLALVDDFRSTGIDLQTCTDDGSAGHHGLVTEPLAEMLEENTAGVHIVACGPDPMLKAVAALAGRFSAACHVSLETPMACGIGICFSCVTPVRDDQGNWDYKRTCVDGPVFDAARLYWGD